MKIKKFNQYIKEISGTELVGPIGPAYGDVKIHNKTINTKHTDVVYSEIDNKFYTIDDYQELYNRYLKKGGKPFNKGNSNFSEQNINTILAFLKKEEQMNNK